MAKSKKAVSLKKDKIRKKIKEILAEIARVDLEKIDKNANIRDEIKLDSLAFVEMLAAIETRLGIILDEAEAFNVITVNDLIKLVESRLKIKNRN